MFGPGDTRQARSKTRVCTWDAPGSEKLIPDQEEQFFLDRIFPTRTVNFLPAGASCLVGADRPAVPAVLRWSTMP